MVETELKECTAPGSEKLDDIIPVFWKKTGTKNGKMGTSEGKQSVQINLDSLVCLSSIQGLKQILKKIVIKDMNVKGKWDKTQQEWF